MTMITTSIKEWFASAIAFLELITGMLRVKLAFLAPYSPPHAPLVWIYINAFCCALSATFFVLGWLPETNPGYVLASDYYISFNLVVCIVWFCEAALWMVFDKSHVWQNTIEFVFAFYYIVEGIAWLIWSEPIRRWEILVWSGVELLFYTYFFVMAILARQKKKTESTEQGEQQAENVVGKEMPPMSEPKDSTTDYELMDTRLV